MEKEMLASANSGDGFVQNFKYILDETRSGFTFVLKGGSGTGKSTLMKKVGGYFLSKGFSLEKFYCSSDLSSLDGIRIVEKNIAIVDGTAPHVWEASMPVVKDRIINLGDYVRKNVKKHAEEIESYMKQKKSCFNIAYALIEIAKRIFNTKELVLKENGFIDDVGIGVFEEIGINNSKSGSIRRLFSSALTNEGSVKIFNDTKYDKIFLNTTDTIASAQLNAVATLLQKKGYDVIVFENPLSTELIEQVIIDELNLSIINKKTKKITEIEAFFNKNIKKYQNLAGKYLSEAKKYHKEIEKYYIQNLDIKRLNVCTNKLISEIEKMN